MTDVLRFEPADGLDLAALTALWNRAYERYFLPLVFSEATLTRHLQRSQIDLSLSVIGSVDGQTFGLSAAGVRGRRAWIGGFGVAVEHRRRGLAARLIEAHLARLDAAGLGAVQLEVIDANPARKVYAAAGFQVVRELLSFEGRLAEGGGDPGVSLDPLAFASAHAALHRARPTWRRETASLLPALAEGAVAVGVMRGGEVAAFAVVDDYVGRKAVVDAAARDDVTARALFDAMAARWPGKELRFVDEPADTPMARAARDAGCVDLIRQVEMVRDREPGPV